MRALVEASLLALKLGVIAFGGPAAHVAMLREEVVVRRRWMTDEEFLDLLGATNLIPGPNSTEMVMHTGMRRAGWGGFFAAGVLFILPASLIVFAFARAYVLWGKTPAAEWILYGIKPVVIAIVAQAIWGLGRAALRRTSMLLLAIAALALYLSGVNEIAILLGAAMLAMAAAALARDLTRDDLPFALAPLALPVAPMLAPYAPAALFLSFLKIGAVLYGSGYVLLAFLRNEFVTRLGWITDAQLLDAITVGQFTPGPLFTSATFVGYLVDGARGAVLATVGIFLPAFVFVAASHRLVPRLRSSPTASAMLDGVNAAALGLMAAVAWQLGRTAIVDPFTGVLAVVAAAILIRWRVNSAWLVAGGAVISVVTHLAGVAS
jgi:chromate transporter